MSAVRVVCVSDLHCRFGGLRVPDGDLLVVAGDMTRRGTPAELRAFDAWLGEQPCTHRVVIAGNHDFGLERDPAARALITQGHYLQDEGITLCNLRIWGSPWQPRFFNWAFNLDRGAPLRAVWDRIPPDTDLLLTHGPPRGVLDRCADGRRVGCADLWDAVQRVRPRLHVFGHIHESYGQVERDGVRYVNASTCDLDYDPVQPPVVVDLT